MNSSHKKKKLDTRQKWLHLQWTFLGIRGIDKAWSCWQKISSKCHSKCVSSFPKHLVKSLGTKHKLPARCLLLSSPTKIHKAVDFDHSYTAEPSTSEEKILKLKKRVHSQQGWLWHRKEKIRNMKDLIANLKLKANIADQQAKVLKYNFSGATLELFTNQMMNPEKGGKDAHQYSTEMKQFAMILHYYSLKVYDFVGRCFPCPTQLAFTPGLVQLIVSLDILQMLSKSWGKAEKRTKIWDVLLVMDAMAIHKGTFWDPNSKSYVGCVDYGLAVPELSDTLATEALVFLAVGIQGHWKHQKAYVFQDQCSAIV